MAPLCLNIGLCIVYADHKSISSKVLKSSFASFRKRKAEGGACLSRLWNQCLSSVPKAVMLEVVWISWSAEAAACVSVAPHLWRLQKPHRACHIYIHKIWAKLSTFSRLESPILPIGSSEWFSVLFQTTSTARIIALVRTGPWFYTYTVITVSVYTKGPVLTWITWAIVLQ